MQSCDTADCKSALRPGKTEVYLHMKKKLLFVEDDTITGTVYKFHFSSAGYKTEVAADGEAALKAVERLPDVVVLDLMLPKLNGVEVLKRIRAQPETAALPVVVFTNVFNGDLGKEAGESGANLCLNKAATNYSRLLEAVHDVLQSALAEQSVLEAGVSSERADSAKPPATPAPASPREEFLQRAPETLAKAGRLAQELVTTKTRGAAAKVLFDLEKSIHFLTALAALGEASLLAQLASALEVLLKKLRENPHLVTSSTLRTVVQAVNLLDVLFQRASTGRPQETAASKVLVVDDDAVSRKLIAAALAVVQLDAVCLGDPNEAYLRPQKEPFGLLITDVRMPGLSGFELCEKLRALPGRSQTPVILVTAAVDFASRVHSARSGADDFIAKPFLSVELAVKALSQLWRGGSEKPPPGFRPFLPGS